MGHLFSAVRRLIVTIPGQFEGHVKQTWCTSLKLNLSFLQGVGADNVIYFGTVVIYFGTLACT